MSEPILYHSTNGKAPAVPFTEALLKGLAPDKGLYLPNRIPVLTAEELESMRELDYPGIARLVLGKYLEGLMDPEVLTALCCDAYDFPVPLEKLGGRNYLMRLDQGPTASFKDFAARMMARMMNHFLRETDRRLLILTATSGDTGSAVASAFFGLDQIEVVVLFPRSEVSEVQRKQMSTLHHNIHVIALDGKFDDCQALVKEAFVDPDLRSLPLSSANSINIGRLIPQSVFYFYAWAQLHANPQEKMLFSVPSGNFGNLMGGILAREMGLPVQRFIIGTNSNREVPDYLQNGIYRIIVPSLHCISSAMNVGHPSNMARIVALYGGQMDEKGDILKAPDLVKLRNDFWALSISDEETMQCIQRCWKAHNTLLEPHGAVAWAALEQYQRENPQPEVPAIAIETAHPAKFPGEIQRLLGVNPPLPPSLAGLQDKTEEMEELSLNYADFKRYLIQSFSEK